MHVPLQVLSGVFPILLQSFELRLLLVLLQILQLLMIKLIFLAVHHPVGFWTDAVFGAVVTIILGHNAELLESRQAALGAHTFQIAFGLDDLDAVVDTSRVATPHGLLLPNLALLVIATFLLLLRRLVVGTVFRLVF